MLPALVAMFCVFLAMFSALSNSIVPYTLSSKGGKVGGKVAGIVCVTGGCQVTVAVGGCVGFWEKLIEVFGGVGVGAGVVWRRRARYESSRGVCVGGGRVGGRVGGGGEFA